MVVPKQKKKMKTSKKVKIEEPTGVVKQEHLVKDEVDDADSDYAVVPEVKAESKKRGAVKEDPQILKKRTRKQIKMKKCDFLDFEAEEDDDHRPIKYNEDDYKRGKSSFVIFLTFCEFLLQRRTPRRSLRGRLKPSATSSSASKNATNSKRASR